MNRHINRAEVAVRIVGALAAALLLAAMAAQYLI